MDLQFTRVMEAKKYRGCYLLWKNGVVVYVGQSVNIMSRVGTHLAENLKDFDGFSYCLFDGDLNDAEAELIARYKPTLNNAMPNNCIYASASQLRKVFSVSGWAWRRLKNSLLPVWRDYYVIEEARAVLNG